MIAFFEYIGRMLKNKYVKGLLIFIIAAIVYDNLVPSFSFSYYQMTRQQYGSNSDITDGALSQLHAITYVVHMQDGEELCFGSGQDSVILQQSNPLHFGLSSFLPFYKHKMTPHLAFDCFIANGHRYIGMVDIEEKITIAGLVNRRTMEELVQKSYIQEAIELLQYKSIPYEAVSVHNPEIVQNDKAGSSTARSSSSVSSSSGLDGKRSRIEVSIKDWELPFFRRLPIRQRDPVYSDTIYFTRHEAAPFYPLYEVYEINRPEKLLTYRSYNAANKLIYSKMFKLEKVDINESKFFYNSYLVYNMVD